MKRPFAAIGAVVGVSVIVYVTLHMSVSPRSAEDLLKLVVGTVYRTFTPEPPEMQFVDEVLKNPEKTGRTLRLLGSATVVEQRGRTTYFRLVRNGSGVHVTYSGTLPSTFSEGVMVVVTGTLDSGGQFQASQLASRIGR